MEYAVSFGRLDGAAPAPPGQALRIALLGDFSGRAPAGLLETGDALAARKPLKADVDDLDRLIARLSPKVTVALGDEGRLDVPVAGLDDFHPDQLVEALPLFEELMTLRRNLGSRAGFERAMKQVLGWAGAEPLPPPASRRAAGGAVATDRRLSDFARLTGRKPAAEADAEALVRRLVGPYVVPATDNRQDALIARVDQALSAAMRRVLHDPAFQAMEAAWRGVDHLVRRLETGARLQIVLYDLSAEELAADLAAHDDLRQSALYRLLVEQPAADADAGPLGLLAGLYGFELSPPHADLLGRIAQLAAAAGAPFIAAIAPDDLLTPEHEWHGLVRSAWGSLRALKASAYLGLATPRFLLRMPYGRRTDPIDAFAFEEFTRQGGLSGMLWGHPAILVAELIGKSWGAKGRAMTPAGGAVGELPVYVYTDRDGDQVALPCTERLFTERQAAAIAATGVIPILSLRGRPEVRVGGANGLGGGTLAGPWGQVDVSSPPPAPPAAVEAAAPAARAEVPAPQADAPEPASVPRQEEPAPAPPPGPLADAPADDLDALLASLSEESPPAAAEETEADLDALLASLK